MADGINWGILGTTPTFQPPQGGTGAAAVQGMQAATDMQQKHALTQQALATAKLQNIQASVAQAGLISDIVGTANDDKTYAQAVKSLNRLGVDTSDAPASYDPSYVAMQRARSKQYLEAMKTQSEIAVNNVNAQIAQAQFGITNIMKGVNAPIPGGSQVQPMPQVYQPLQPAGGQAPMGGQPQPGMSPQGAMPMQAGMQPGASPSPMAQGAPQPQGMPTSPTQMPSQPQQAAPQGQQPFYTPQSGMSYPEYIKQQETAGTKEAESYDALRTRVLNRAATVPDTDMIIKNARYAIDHGIQTGPYTGVAREWLSPTYAQMLDKSVSYLLQQQIASLAGTGNRVMQGEIQTFLKGLPANLTMKEVNQRIVDMLDMQNKRADLEADALYTLKQQGITDSTKVSNILRHTWSMINPINASKGEVNLNNTGLYDKALQAAVQGKRSLVTDEDIKATAQKHGITEDQVRQQLKAQGVI